MIAIWLISSNDEAPRAETKPCDDEQTKDGKNCGRIRRIYGERISLREETRLITSRVGGFFSSYRMCDPVSVSVEIRQLYVEVSWVFILTDSSIVIVVG